MITLTFAWGVSGLVIGFLGGTYDVRLAGLILLGIAAVMWTLNSFYTGWVRNRNASAMLKASAERKRSGGAL